VSPERRIGIGAAVVLLAATAGLLSMVLGGGGPGEAGGAVEEPAAPSPEPVAHPGGVPRATRASLPPPAGIERPQPPPEPLPPARVTPDDRREMNYAVDGVLRAARVDCLEPFLADAGAEPGAEEEFVFDAVLYDGRLYDVGLRSMGHDLPDSVLACVADRAWYSDWPEWDLGGELRLQRSIAVRAP
jgi:hypothetical protein